MDTHRESYQIVIPYFKALFGNSCSKPVHYIKILYSILSPNGQANEGFKSLPEATLASFCFRPTFNIDQVIDVGRTVL